MPITSLSGSGLLSMTWEEDYVNANAGSPVDGTWYTITDYDGKGRLMGLGGRMETTTTTGEIRITSDGNAHTMVKGTVSFLYISLVATGGYFYKPFDLEFTSSLKVELRRDGDTNAIHGLTSYGILSEEFKREIVLAGNKLPNRNYTYPVDVMVVWFTGPHGVSNKIQFLPGIEKQVIKYTKASKPSGEIQDPSFDITVNGDRYMWSRSKKTKSVEVVLRDGSKHTVPVVNGVIDNSFLPVTKQTG